LHDENAHPAPVVSGTLTTTTTGIQMQYRDWGGSGRPILLLHGLASSSRIWDLVAPRLTPYGRVVALDQRGHGASAKPDDGYDFATIVADAQGAVVALGLRAPVVIGHSWGAGVALTYAAHDRECPGVVLVDGGLMDMQARPDATWEDTAVRLAPPDLSHFHLDDLVRHMGQGPLGGLDESFRRSFFRSLMEEQPDGTVRPRLTREHHMAILHAMWDQRLAPVLSRVICPILAIMAEPAQPADEADPFQAAKRRSLAEAAQHPNVHIVTLPDTIHDIPLHRPAELARLIGDWLAALPEPN
jgi:pimeloyl-ACP methyl ester carboxylesterase